MKIYALKWNNEIIGLYLNKFDAHSSHQWERDEIKSKLEVVAYEATEIGKE